MGVRRVCFAFISFAVTYHLDSALCRFSGCCELAVVLCMRTLQHSFRVLLCFALPSIFVSDGVSPLASLAFSRLGGCLADAHCSHGSFLAPSLPELPSAPGACRGPYNNNNNKKCFRPTCLENVGWVLGSKPMGHRCMIWAAAG